MTKRNPNIIHFADQTIDVHDLVLPEVYSTRLTEAMFQSADLLDSIDCIIDQLNCLKERLLKDKNGKLG